MASQRPDLLRVLVLSNTAAKLGTSETWAARIDAIEAQGLNSIADAVMERWFAPAFRATSEMALWRNMMVRTSVAGYLAPYLALGRADQTTETHALHLPVLVIAGAEDGASPPDVVRATADLIPDAAFHIIPGAGHLPCVEAPTAFAALIAPFLKEYAHG